MKNRIKTALDAKTQSRFFECFKLVSFKNIDIFFSS